MHRAGAPAVAAIDYTVPGSAVASIEYAIGSVSCRAVLFVYGAYLCDLDAGARTIRSD